MTDSPRTHFYTTTQLGEHQHETPEGFLLCMDVPIARTGTQLYAAGELPAIQAGPDGTITIERHPEQVFDAKTVASFNGKSVVVTHPSFGVRVEPSNWRQLEVGVATNVRRGVPPLDPDYLYADFLIKDPEAIKLIRTKEMREVSAGYDAEYEQLGPGRARQYDIIGNHIALVERGRCGPACAIGDTAEELHKMGLRDAMAAVRDSIGKARRAARTGDAEGAVEELDKIPDMLGKVGEVRHVVSGDDMPGEVTGVPGTEAHHVTVNIHNPPGAGGKPLSEDVPEVADPAAVAAPAAGGGDPVAAALADIQSRLSAIEEAIAVLAGGEEEEEGDEPSAEGDEPGATGEIVDPAKKPAVEPEAEEGKPTGDRRGTRDSAPGGSNAPGGNRAVVGDSASMRAQFQQVISRAAILVPDIRLPTFDSAKPAVYTADALCALRRETLRQAWATDDGHRTLEPLLAGRNPDFTGRAMTCGEAAIVFDAASEMLRAERGRVPLRSGSFRQPAGTGAYAGPPTPAEINKRNRERFHVA